MEFMDTKEFNKKDQCSLVWKMHNSCRMSSVMQKDKKSDGFALFSCSIG